MSDLIIILLSSYINPISSTTNSIPWSQSEYADFENINKLFGSNNNFIVLSFYVNLNTQ